MALATLSIDLVAKLAQLQAGMDQAVAIVGRGVAGMDRQLGTLKALASGIGAALVSGLSVAGLVAVTRATVDGIDKLNDLRDATGATVENLSALEDIGVRTGTSIDTVGDAVVKLNKVLGEALPNTDSERALRAIGLNAEELRRLDPAEALRQVSVALAGYADDQNKARLIQELFGKSAREIAPFLHDLAEAGTLNATVTTEQAKAAEAFNQQLFRLKKNSEDSARAIVSDLLPALNKFLEDFKKSGGIGGSIAARLGLDEQGQIERRLADVNQRASQASDQIDRMAEELSRDPGNKFLATRVDKARERLQALQREAQGYSQALKDLADQKAPLPQDYSHEGRNRPTPAVVFSKRDPEAEKAAREYEKLAASIGMVTSATAAEAAGADKATELQNLRVRLLEQLNNGEVHFTAAQRASLQAMADSLPLLDEQLRVRRAQLEVIQHSLRLAAQQQRALAGEFATRVETTNALRDQAEEYGKTAEQIEALRIQRLEDKAAQEELLILTLQNVEGTEQEVAARQLNVKALRDQVALRKQLAQVQLNTRTDPTEGAQRALDEYLLRLRDAGTATHDAVAQGLATLEDDIVRSLASGKASVKSFVNYALQEFIRLQVVRPLLGSLVGGAGAFMGGGLGGLTAFFSGSSLGSSGFGTGLAYGNQDFGGFFADGGYLGAGKWGVAGDAGPEIIKGPAQVVPVQKAGPTYVVNVQGDASENTISLIQAAMAAQQARGL